MTWAPYIAAIRYSELWIRYTLSFTTASVMRYTKYTSDAGMTLKM
jgi:hypothetical protein